MKQEEEKKSPQEMVLLPSLIKEVIQKFQTYQTQGDIFEFLLKI